MLGMQSLRRIMSLQPYRIVSCFSEWGWEQFPKPWNVKHTKQEKRMLYKGKHNRPVPHFRTDIYDVLYIAGMDQHRLTLLQKEIIEDKEIQFSSQFVAYYLYNFIKNDMLYPEIYAKIEPYIAGHKGEYTLRAAFGGLYTMIILGKENYIDFFINEMHAQEDYTPTFLEAVEIIQAFNKSKLNWSLQQKHQFWERHFKPHFDTNFAEAKIRQLKDVFRFIDAFYKFEYFTDESIWNRLIDLTDRKKGWKRTTIIQKLYPLTGTFEKAKEVFDKYYIDLSNNKNIQWRYNLEELRLYSSEEMIAKSQIDIKMVPPFRHFFTDRAQCQKINADYQKWKVVGSVTDEGQIIKDKSQSLAYAIKDRYFSLKADNVDFSKMNKEEFEDLFGTYDGTYDPDQPEEKDANKELTGSELERVQNQILSALPTKETEEGEEEDDDE